MAAIRAGVPLFEFWQFGDVTGSDGDPQRPDPVLGDDTPGGQILSESSEL